MVSIILSIPILLAFIEASEKYIHRLFFSDIKNCVCFGYYCCMTNHPSSLVVRTTRIILLYYSFCGSQIWGGFNQEDVVWGPLQDFRELVAGVETVGASQASFPIFLSLYLYIFIQCQSSGQSLGGKGGGGQFGLPHSMVALGKSVCMVAQDLVCVLYQAR